MCFLPKTIYLVAVVSVDVEILSYCSCCLLYQRSGLQLISIKLKKGRQKVATLPFSLTLLIIEFVYVCIQYIWRYF